MTKSSQSKKAQSVAKIDTLTDEIKDEIDRLHEINDVKMRRSVAIELVEYLQLHHIDNYE